jgi:hypothetical protein
MERISIGILAKTDKAKCRMSTIDTDRQEIGIYSRFRW